MAGSYDSEFSFHEQLWHYYSVNRGKIRSRYNDLTRKFLAYNDREENPNAFLRKPQFEALEMYVFIKEFMGNPQVYQMFDDWRNKRNNFSDASYYSVSKNGQMRLFDAPAEQLTDTLFKQMKKYRENYPNYIYALAMGLGKTILMATCIFYEFLLANKYPKDKRFCHNTLVFAPDKTVLQSLQEIMTFDKTKVVPPEYARVLDANIKFHFLDETGTVLHTIDYSDFNIVISNTQKIIVKKKRKEETPAQLLFNDSLLKSVYSGGDDDDAWDDTTLMDNQRFKKLCRLPQLGVYVDEAHHLFGADLETQIRSSGNANKTSLRDTINMLAEATSIIACYNYTGTPYVKNQILPEVVYAYGLRESIWNGYLKDADTLGYENVKSEEFLRAAVTTFLERYGGKTYEGLKPKLAIYAARVEEAVTEVRPVLEKILAEFGISANSILLNVGDDKYTKDEQVQLFKKLDVPDSEGNEKQFIILVEKGKEGWNCRSLFGVALFRSPKSKVFVLQATMRCLRAITKERLTATVFLSKENFDILNDELHKNFNMDLQDIKVPSDDRHKYKVRVLPPPRTITLKRIWHEYTLHQKEYSTPVNFKLDGADFSKYQSLLYEGDSLARDTTIKEKVVDHLQNNMKYSAFTLAGEVARYLNISCVLASRILRESVDGMNAVLDAVNRYNAVLDDYIIPTVFHALFDVKLNQRTEDRELVLLREPKDAGYYEFSAKDSLVLTNQYPGFTPDQIKKSFHADTYCFDSVPEKECFMQYITSNKVKEVYFTGMFTANQGDLSIYYYDPDSGRIRQYYPDFLAKMADGSYQLIEVKGDNKIDDVVVKAKQAAAEEMAVASGVTYKMYAGSRIINSHILDDDPKEVVYDMSRVSTPMAAETPGEFELQ